MACFVSYILGIAAAVSISTLLVGCGGGNPGISHTTTMSPGATYGSHLKWFQPLGDFGDEWEIFRSSKHESISVSTSGTVLAYAKKKYHTSLFAFAAQDGAAKWEYRLDTSIEDVPVLGPDGTAYFLPTIHELRAVNDAGSTKWVKTSENLTSSLTEFVQPTERIVSCLSALVVGTNGTLLVKIWTNKGDVLLALDAEDGSVKWPVYMPTNHSRCGAFGMSADGAVFVVCGEQLMKLNGTNGSKKWTSNVQLRFNNWEMVEANGTVFLYRDNQVIAINSQDGLQKWWQRSVLPHPVNIWRLTVGVDGTIFFVSVFQDLAALHGENGTIKWAYGENANNKWANRSFVVSHRSGVVSSNGMVYVGCGHYDLCAFDADTGSSRWTSVHVWGGGTFWAGSGPILGPDGTIYMAPFDCAIHCGFKLLAWNGEDGLATLDDSWSAQLV